MTIADEIAKNYQRCFRRVKIKRRLTSPSGSNYYEADWLDVTDKVPVVDDITWNIDNLELNQFTQGGLGLTCKNDNFEWGKESISTSVFFNYLTRHKTKIKIEGGYIAADETEYSYDIGAGLIVGGSISAQSDGTIYIPCDAPGTLFEEAAADYIYEKINVDGTTDWWDAKTISTVVQYLYDLQRSGAYVFHPFLEGSDILPANDIVADLYNFADWSCKDALDKMAEVSNSAHWVGADFRLKFQSKTETVAVQYVFNGPGTNNPNILKAYDYNEGINNVYNRISWYNTDPLVEAIETWTPGDSSSTYKYGQRTYSVDNRLVTTGATRQTICDNLLAAYKSPKEEITIETKFVPQLKLLDKVTLNYYGDYSTYPASLYGITLVGKGAYTGRRGGIKITKNMKIIKITHDVMTFKSTLVLREV